MSSQTTGFMALERVLARVVDDLTYRYSDTFERAEVQAMVDQGRQALEPTNRHPEFLPILIERYARDHLLTRAKADGRIAKTVPEVLYVCEHNEGRSQMAAALTDHIGEGHVHVRSAGLHPTGRLNPHVVQALSEIGVRLDHPYPTAISGDVLHAADVVVLMGCSSPVPELTGRRYLEWSVPDPRQADPQQVRVIRDDIISRVRGLLADLQISPPLHSTPRPTADLPVPGAARA